MILFNRKILHIKAILLFPSHKINLIALTNKYQYKITVVICALLCVFVAVICICSVCKEGNIGSVHIFLSRKFTFGIKVKVVFQNI